MIASSRLLDEGNVTSTALLIIRKSLGSKICKLCRRRLCPHIVGLTLILSSMQQTRSIYINPTHEDQVALRFRLFDGYMNDGNEAMFHEYTRLTFSEFHEIYSRIEPRLQHMGNHRYPIKPIYRLAICLRYLGHGRSFHTLGHEFRLGRSTIASIVHEVCEAIIAEFREEVLATPTVATWKASAEGFARLYNYPRGIGAIDGKHFKCFAPKNSGSRFFNFKGTYSIVLLLVVDSRYNILLLDCGGNGRVSDSGLFRTSSIKTFLERSRQSFPPPAPLGQHGLVDFHLLADGGFPQASWMQRPFQQSEAYRDPRKSHFNEVFSSARRVVESVFGILCSRFRLFHAPLSGTPDHMKMIIVTACVLHNLLTKKLGEGILARYPQAHYIEENRPHRQSRHSDNNAHSQRDRLVSYFAERDGF